MRKYVSLVFALFILYVLVQLGFNYLGNGHLVEYTLKDGETNLMVSEVYRKNSKIDPDMYAFTIKAGDVSFSTSTTHHFNSAQEVIEDIKYYSDDKYKCIFIKYIDNVVIDDVLCNNGKYSIPFHNINNPSEGLKNFVGDLISKEYNLKKYADDLSDPANYEGNIVYSNNMIKSHFLAYEYKNYLFRVNKIERFGSTSYENVPALKIFLNDKYIVLASNWMKSYSITSSRFNEETAAIDATTAKIIGTYNDSIYMMIGDKEYEYDTVNNTALEVGSKDTNIKYYMGGTWKHIPYAELNNSDEFGSEYTNDYKNSDYTKVIKRGKNIGYYYYFKKVNNGYNVFRSNINDKDSITYLFTTTDINSIRYVGDYIYYLADNSIRYYKTDKGNRTLYVLKEKIPNFNYNVYLDKTKEA
jgi:hypothetical protein